MSSKYTDIPKIFYDTVDEVPLRECNRCGKDLLESGEPYVIEKGFKRKEVLFEHAICMQCAEKMKQELSKESLANIERFMMERADFEGRMEELLDEDYSNEKWLGRCIISGEALEEQEEYQIQGMFVGDRMLTLQFPYMIGGKALEEMQELLSAETRDELDRIKDDLIKVPPEFEDILKPKFVPMA